MPEQPPAKRVVKKVVKRPATRPGGAGSGGSTATKRVPSGTSSARPRPAAKVSSRSPGKARPTATVVRKPAAASTKPSRPPLSAKLAPLRTGVVRGVKRVGGSIGAGAGSVRDVAIIRSEQVRSWRIPRLQPTRGAAVTGLLAGLLTALLGWLAMLGFSQVRGVSTGGGRWGSLTVVVLVALIAFFATRLLRAMDIAQSATITLLGLATSVVIILALFLGPVAGPWAWLILPVTATVSFVIAERLVALAERPTEA